MGLVDVGTVDMRPGKFSLCEAVPDIAVCVNHHRLQPFLLLGHDNQDLLVSWTCEMPPGCPNHPWLRTTSSESVLWQTPTENEIHFHEIVCFSSVLSHHLEVTDPGKAARLCRKAKVRHPTSPDYSTMPLMRHTPCLLSLCRSPAALRWHSWLIYFLLQRVNSQQQVWGNSVHSGGSLSQSAGQLAGQEDTESDWRTLRGLNLFTEYGFTLNALYHWNLLIESLFMLDVLKALC